MANNQAPARALGVDPAAPQYRPSTSLRRKSFASKVLGVFRKPRANDFFTAPYFVPYLKEVMIHRIGTYRPARQVPPVVLDRAAKVFAAIFALGHQGSYPTPRYLPTIETIQTMTDDFMILEGQSFCEKYGVADLYKMMTGSQP